jgi:hypothetical protein
VGRDCDLPAQSRVTVGVNDLHDDIGTHVDVMGGALGDSHRAGVEAKGRCRDRTSAIARLPQLGQRRSQQGADGLRAGRIRVSSRKPILQTFYLHTVVSRSGLAGTDRGLSAVRRRPSQPGECEFLPPWELLPELRRSWCD